MTDVSIGEKEKVQILLAEYSSLRSEINARMSSIYQVAAIVAVTMIWLLNQNFGPTLVVGWALALIGLFLCGWALTRDCVRAALRVRELEREINRRANDHLLVWECEWGGQTSSIWSNRLLYAFLRLNRPPYLN
jgi:hypothetical protein